MRSTRSMRPSIWPAPIGWPTTARRWPTTAGSSARRRVEWVGQPRRAVWLADPLRIRVDPELHVTIDGDPHVIKLYLKAHPSEALTQRTANPLAWLLDHCHGHLGRPLVLDVLRGRAFGLTGHGRDYESLLRAQAAAFVSLWDGGFDRGQQV